MKISDYYTYAPKSKIKAGDANPNGKYQFYTSSPDESRRCDEYLYDCKAIVMGTGGSATLHYYDGKFSTSTDCLTLIPNEKIRAKYLYYFFLANMDVLEAGFKGAGLKHTSKGYIDNIEITKIPSLPSQDKIVNLFDELALRIEKERRQIEKLDELVKARFVEMFGTREKWNDANWKIASIDEIIEKPKSGEWGQKDESGRGIGVIRTTNFSDGGAVYFNSITTRDIPREKLITKGIKNGDILIEKSGGSDKKPVGRVVLYTGESNKYLNNNFTAILRINNNAEVNNIFLFTFLYINYWQGGTKVFENKTTGIHNLNLKEFLNKTKIALPDMSLQNQFATFVAQVDKSKFVLSNELTMCDFYIRLIHDRVMHSRINLRVAQ